MAVGIILTLFLVLLNGFFVAAEFAIVKVRSSQIDIKIEEGDSVAGIAKHITSHLDAYLSATQLGITLASLGLGWIGEDVVTEVIMSLIGYMNLSLSEATAHSMSLPIAFGLITVLHIVFGELAPKSIAIRFPLPVTLTLSAPLRFFYFLFFPLIWILNGFSNFLLRLIGIQPVTEQEGHTEEEIRVILGESLESGNIRHSEHVLIENVFRFDQNTVKKIMIPRTKVAAVSIDEKPEVFVSQVIEEGYSRWPVYKTNLDNVVGVIYLKDLFRQMNDGSVDINQILHQPYFVPESKKIGDLLKDFQNKKMHLAIVVDEFGGTSGIVTLEDILEEIVGEIQDESDDEPDLIEVVTADQWIAKGSTTIEQLNQKLPIPLPLSQEYETLSGLVSHFHHGIPDKGENVKVDDYELCVLLRSPTSIDSVRITKKG